MGRKKDIKKEKARDAVKHAIKAGRLIRPERCQMCQKIPALTKNGKSSVQAHHHNYDKPLDVEWLCTKCHRAVTPVPAVVGGPALGERNYQSRLTAEKVMMIRRLHATNLSYQEIANCFGVHLSTIARVARKEYWIHVNNDVEFARVAKSHNEIGDGE